MEATSEFLQKAHIKIDKDKFVKVVVDEGGTMPTKAHPLDAGFDMYLPEDVVLFPFEAKKIGMKIHLAVPEGYDGQIRPRSSADTLGIYCTGTIDCEYTGEIKVNLRNLSREIIKLEKGYRVVQIVFERVLMAELLQVDTLEATERGNDGFGSSGR